MFFFSSFHENKNWNMYDAYYVRTHIFFKLILVFLKYGLLLLSD